MRSRFGAEGTGSAEDGLGAHGPGFMFPTRRRVKERKRAILHLPRKTKGAMIVMRSYEVACMLKHELVITPMCPFMSGQILTVALQAIVSGSN